VFTCWERLPDGRPEPKKDLLAPSAKLSSHQRASRRRVDATSRGGGMIDATMIRKLAVWSLIVGVWAGSGLAPALATTGSQLREGLRARAEWCDNRETNIAKDYAANSDPADDAGWAASKRALGADSKMEADCEGHDDYVDALLASWHAQTSHHDGEDWKPKMDLANSLLNQCVTANAGKDRGTQCATELKANAQRATNWGSPTDELNHHL
jgi:hypothetical protein